MKCQFIVTVDAPTPDQAEQVLLERLSPDEDYGFPYTLWFTGSDTTGTSYCPVHCGIANEDMDDCDFRGSDPDHFVTDSDDDDGEPSECNLIPCYYPLGAMP